MVRCCLTIGNQKVCWQHSAKQLLIHFNFFYNGPLCLESIDYIFKAFQCFLVINRINDVFDDRNLLSSHFTFYCIQIMFYWLIAACHIQIITVFVHGEFYGRTVDKESAAVCQGDLVDVAFTPQVNEFRGERTVQLNLQDIRPHCQADCCADTSAYHALRCGGLTPSMASQLLPDRATLGMVWRYISAAPELRESPMCLLRKIVRWSGRPLDLGQLMTCLDIFSDVELLDLTWQHKYILLRPRPWQEKADLNRSRTMQRLQSVKES